jgi:DNA-binding NtrC family response regulator
MGFKETLMTSVLLVDDDPHLLKALERQLVLRAADWEVTTARNGLEALRLLRTKDFDLVITDVLMPEQDGLGMIREIRRTGHTTKIIAMTGGGFVVDVNILRVALALGAGAVLEKPFPIELLIDTARRVLSLEEPEEALPAKPRAFQDDEPNPG